MKKNMYIVKIEVMATSIHNALKDRSKGSVYEVSMASEQYQPNMAKPVGFIKKKTDES